jgi:hypothetical protein
MKHKIYDFIDKKKGLKHGEAIKSRIVDKKGKFGRNPVKMSDIREDFLSKILRLSSYTRKSFFM